MKRRSQQRLVVTAAAAFAVALLAAGCEPELPESDPSTEPAFEGPTPEHQFDAADTRITYAFTDSSVPPEYHRSFVLTIVDGMGTIVVDSYGDETARDEQAVGADNIAHVIGSYNAGELVGLFNPDLPDDEGCAGGQTFELMLADSGAEASTSIYRCDDASEEVALALAGAASPLLTAFDIDSLTEDRYRL